MITKRQIRAVAARLPPPLCGVKGCGPYNERRKQAVSALIYADTTHRPEYGRLKTGDRSGEMNIDDKISVAIHWFEVKCKRLERSRARLLKKEAKG